MKLLKFTERNDWEGETCNFYVWMDEETESKLRKILTHEYAKSYSLGKKNFTEDQVKELMACESRSTYMDEHNLCGILNLPECPEFYSFEKEDFFYKGGIEKFCTPKQEASK